jgi:hypothetical protein
LDACTGVAKAKPLIRANKSIENLRLFFMFENNLLNDE